jgi:hypothetical protein
MVVKYPTTPPMSVGGSMRKFCERARFPRVALKAEMIEVRFHRILDHHQYKCRVFAGGYGRPQPNIMSPFFAPIAHDRQTADAGVEINRPIYIADIDGDVGPTNHCLSCCRQALARHISQDFAETIQFPQRGVKIWGDADAHEFFVRDRRSENVMLAE